MQVQNAIKKLEKAGYTVAQQNHSGYRASKGGKDVIEFLKNGGSNEITCIEVRDKSAKDDSQTDYFAGTWCDSITQAIKLAH